MTIPDLFNYWLSGEITNEFTNATTTQCFDPRTRAWATPVLDALNIPTHLFRPVTEPGTLIGTLLPQVAEETGAGGVRIVVPACHDTGSAVVAVPARESGFRLDQLGDVVHHGRGSPGTLPDREGARI